MKKTLLTVLAATMMLSCNQSTKTSASQSDADSTTTDSVATVEKKLDFPTYIKQAKTLNFLAAQMMTEEIDGQEVRYSVSAKLALNEDGTCQLIEIIQDDIEEKGTYVVSDHTIKMNFPNRWDGKDIEGTFSDDFKKITLSSKLAGTLSELTAR